MANEINIPTGVPPLTSLTVYAVVTLNGEIWNTNTNAFENYQSANQHYYAVPCPETPSQSGWYSGNFPTAITTAATYLIYAYKQASGTPNSNDTELATGPVVWSGSQESTSGNSDLITLAFAKAFLKITVSTYDALLTTLVSAASQAVIDYCRRDFNITSYVETHDLGDYQQTLLLRQYPIQSITSVTLYPNGQNPMTIQGTSVDVSNYGAIRIKQNTDVVPTIFGPGFQSVQVNYTAGYPTIPLDLQQATAIVTSRMYFQAGKDTTYDSEKLENYSYSYKDNSLEVISDEVKAMLAPYKRNVM